MSHEKIKNLFSEAVSFVVSDISQYVIHSEKEFTKKMNLQPSVRWLIGISWFVAS